MTYSTKGSASHKVEFISSEARDLKFPQDLAGSVFRDDFRLRRKSRPFAAFMVVAYSPARKIHKLTARNLSFKPLPLLAFSPTGRDSKTEPCEVFEPRALLRGIWLLRLTIARESRFRSPRSRSPSVGHSLPRLLVAARHLAASFIKGS